MVISRRTDVMNTDRWQSGVLWLIILAGGCASILMFWITARGPGISPDSTVYIASAKSLLSGKGFFVDSKPMTHFPPAYPLLIAAAGLFQHGDMLQAARLLCVLLFGVNTVLIGLAVRMCTDRNILATGCAIFFFLSSARIMSVHSMAWSEPMFITFSLAALVLFSVYVARPTLCLLLLASFIAGVAIATRYVGVTLLPPMVFAILLFGDQPMKHKIRHTILSTAIASLPIASWLIRNVLTTQTATTRTVAIHPISLSHAKALIIMIYDFALPVSISSWTKTLHLGVAIALFFSALALLHRKEYIRRNANSVRIALPTLCFVFFLTYMAFLVIAISFFDAHIPIDSRILMPALLSLSVVGISLAWFTALATDKRFIWYSFVFFALLSIGINGNLAILKAVDIHKNGRGYTSRYWQSSEIASCLADVYDARRIYSNVPGVIRFLAEKEAVIIPHEISPSTRRLNQDYEEQLSEMCTECREGEAVLVYFNGDGPWYLPSIEELESKCNLPVLRRLKVGVVYAKQLGTEAEQNVAPKRFSSPLQRGR